MKAITPTHYAVECNLNWLPVPRNLNQNTRSSPARVNERASGDETRAIYIAPSTSLLPVGMPKIKDFLPDPL